MPGGMPGLVDVYEDPGFRRPWGPRGPRTPGPNLSRACTRGTLQARVLCDNVQECVHKRHSDIPDPGFQIYTLSFLKALSSGNYKVLLQL